MEVKRIELKSFSSRGVNIRANSHVGNPDWTLRADLNQNVYDQNAGYTLCSLFKFYHEEITGGKKLFR